METFKSWLVANLEIVYVLALILIILATALFGDLSGDDWVVVVCVSILQLIISFMSIKHGFVGFIVSMVFGVGVLLFFFLREIVAERIPHLLVIGVVALVSGIVIAIYSYQHFDEVVSRRFMYRNSNVSVFEQAWKYAFNRFFAGFMLVFGLVLELFVIIHVDQIDLDKVLSNFTQETIESSVKPSTQTKTEAVFPMKFTATGSIHEGSKDYPVELLLQMEETSSNQYKVRGFYRYQSQPANKRIYLNGGCNKNLGTISLISMDQTERFELRYNEGHSSLEGTWSQYDSEDDSEKATRQLEVFLTLNNH